MLNIGRSQLFDYQRKRNHLSDKSLQRIHDKPYNFVINSFVYSSSFVRCRSRSEVASQMGMRKDLIRTRKLEKKDSLPLNLFYVSSSPRETKSVRRHQRRASIFVDVVVDVISFHTQFISVSVKLHHLVWNVFSKFLLRFRDELQVHFVSLNEIAGSVVMFFRGIFEISLDVSLCVDGLRIFYNVIFPVRNV